MGFQRLKLKSSLQLSPSESRPSSIHFPFYKGIHHSLAHSAIWHPMNVSYARRTDRVLKRKHWQSATQFIAQFWVYSIELEIISFLSLIQQLSEKLSTLPSIIQLIPFSDMFLELTKLYPHFSTGSWDYWNLTSSQDKASIRPSILTNWPVHRERVHFNLFLAHADTAQKESSTRRTALSSKQNSCIHDMAGRRALMRNISAPTPPTTRVKEQLRPLTSSTHQHSFQTTLLSFKSVLLAWQCAQSAKELGFRGTNIPKQ